MTEQPAAVLRRRGGPLLAAAVWLRDTVARHPAPFMLLWLGGLIALVPLSLLPGTAPPTGVWDVDLSLDKFFHVVAYGGLSGIPVLALASPRRRLLAVLVVLLASLAFEIGQGFVPGRSFGYDDLLANLGGVALGAATAWWIRRLSPAV